MKRGREKEIGLMAFPNSNGTEAGPWKLAMEDGKPIKPPVTVKYTKLFINGEFVDSVSGNTYLYICLLLPFYWVEHSLLLSSH